MNKQQWISFLDNPFPTNEEWLKAFKSANNWGCCAVGSLIFDDSIDPTLKKNKNCIATLNKLVVNLISGRVLGLGMEFYYAIECKNIDHAKRVFDKIHKIKVKKAL